MNSTFPFTGVTIVVRQINSTSVGLPVVREGFYENVGGAINYFFTTPDCSGPAFMDVTNLPRVAVVVNGTALYGRDPARKLLIGSTRQDSFDGTSVTMGACFGAGYQQWVGRAESFNLEGLNFSAPFEIK